MPAGVQHAERGGVPLIHSRLVEVARPTSLDFGPDGRLYVSQIDGAIVAYTIARHGPGRYRVTATETIDAVQGIPNQDEDGTPRPRLRTRLVTGILVEGTAKHPVIYVTSSDPRLGDKAKTDLGIDTDSGVLSRLTFNGSWVREDLVVGLPRSGEDHAPHGIARRGDTLLIAQGGNTNMGAPSKSFSGIGETPWSAAILEVDLAKVPVDLRLKQDAVRLFATGFRNPYDVAVAADGSVFTIDNGPNRTWGGVPATSESGCTNGVVEGGSTYPDLLHRVKPEGYHGHPNPSRKQCDFLDPASRPTVLTRFPTSTNGLAIVTASGPMQGDLLTVSFLGELIRVRPDTGEATTLATGFGAWPLDVTTQGDDEIFPGTIWVAVHLTERIQVFEPVATEVP